MKTDYMRRAMLNPYQRFLKDRIGRGRDHWEMGLDKRGATLDEFIIFTLKKRRMRHLVSKIKTLTQVPVYARVSDNRWIADCECGGAEAVDYVDPRFFCLGCFNDAFGNMPRRVIFPADLDEIEDILTARDDPLTRGYTPAEAVLEKPNLAGIGLHPESATTLIAENAVHGLPPKRGG